MRSRKPGSLSVVGVGIRAPEQATLEACARIRAADLVYTLVANPLAEHWIRTLNRNVKTLNDLYARDKDRSVTYREMVRRLVRSVQSGRNVCAVSYGHPGVFAFPFHEAILRLKQSGFSTEMLPAVSAEDCLFADLGIDPATAGCRSYEATDFLVNRRNAEITSALILWQIGVIAEPSYKSESGAWNRTGLRVLAETLLEAYPPEHEVVVYEAARFPACIPAIDRLALRELADASIGVMSTLYVPPASRAQPSIAVLARLGVLSSTNGSTAASSVG